VLADADELVRNFLLLVTEKGRADELDEMVREFEALVAAEEGILDVELTTALELSDAERKKILGQIEQVSGRKLRATRRVDPSLIGGFVLRAGSHRVDASVRGRLERLRRELKGVT
jgi:F-type H+-transporting ATPase subunit delta